METESRLAVARGWGEREAWGPLCNGYGVLLRGDGKCFGTSRGDGGTSL